MKALITGITGFAGNYLAQLLLAHGLEVYGISQETEFRPFLAIDRSSVRYFEADIRNQQRIADLLSDIRPDLVFHLAAKSSPSTSVREPFETFAVNFGGTLNLLEGIRLTGIRCRFLMVSTSHVYGDVALRGPLAEESALKPQTPYAASKAAAEMAAYQYRRSYGIETITVRAFNHTGAGQGEGFVCPDLARKVVEIERGLRPPKLAVRNLQRRIDFSDVRDIVRGYYSALLRGAPGETYNLCSGRAVSLQTIVEQLTSWSGTTIEVQPAAEEGREERGTIGDGSRARLELSWEPVIPFSETARAVVEYWRRSYKPSTGPQECGNLQAAHDVHL